MTLMQPEGKIIGYIIPASVFPYWAKIVYQQGDSLFLRYPSLSNTVIGPITSLDRLRREIDNREFKEKHPEAADLCDLFIDQVPQRKISSDQYAFAISKDLILVDTPKNMYHQLERLTKEGCLSDRELRGINKFLKVNAKDA